MAQAKDEARPEEADEIVVEEDEIVIEEAPTSEAPTATATLTDERTEEPAGAERVVYVSPPEPPKARGNRVLGALLALAGAVLFGVLYALAAAILLPVTDPAFHAAGLGAFLQQSIFWVPVLLFTVGFVLVVLALNRAAWWAHVLGSLVVALVVYLGSIGLLLLVTSLAGGTSGFRDVALNPFVLAAAVVAREVSIWVGLVIAWRGGKVAARNRAERAAFDAEQAGKATDGASAARG